MPFPQTALRTAGLVWPTFSTAHTVLVNTRTKLRPDGVALNAQMFHIQNYSTDKGSSYRVNSIFVPVS
jgi:hypothetical protein